MKRILAATVLLTLCSTAAFATSIITSKHNLSTSSSGSIKSSTQTQICIFCHTPHNAVKNIPLWNRTGTGTSYQLYTSSATLTAATKAAKIDDQSMSMFCLSCHDGTVSQIGTRIVRGVLGAADMQNNWGGGGLTADGKSLTNDHPIGFNYNTAQTQAPTELIAAPGQGIVFYKSTANPAGGSMECSSCHGVHNDQYGMFLRTSNAGSKLCLACHNK